MIFLETIEFVHRKNNFHRKVLIITCQSVALAANGLGQQVGVRLPGHGPSQLTDLCIVDQRAPISILVERLEVEAHVAGQLRPGERHIHALGIAKETNVVGGVRATGGQDDHVQLVALVLVHRATLHVSGEPAAAAAASFIQLANDRLLLAFVEADHADRERQTIGAGRGHSLEIVAKLGETRFEKIEYETTFLLVVLGRTARTLSFGGASHVEHKVRVQCAAATNVHREQPRVVEVCRREGHDGRVHSILTGESEQGVRRSAQGAHKTLEKRHVVVVLLGHARLDRRRKLAWITWRRKEVRFNGQSRRVSHLPISMTLFTGYNKGMSSSGSEH